MPTHPPDAAHPFAALFSDHGVAIEPMWSIAAAIKRYFGDSL